MIKKLIIAIIFLSLFFTPIFSQNQYVLHPDSKIAVEGGSTLTDWKAVVNQFDGMGTLGSALSKKSIKTGKALSELSLTCVVESMDGGRGPAMNKKIRTALKMTEHPTISFKASSSAVKEVLNKAEKTFLFTATGDLTIAGVTKEVEIELEGKREADKLLLNGSKDLKLSTFDIKAPSAMFGQIETKDDISIQFELILTQK